MRCKADEGKPDTLSDSKLHPFSLLSTKIKRLLKQNPNFFEVYQDATMPDTVASTFVNSAEYTSHELVRLCEQHGGEVVVW